MSWVITKDMISHGESEGAFGPGSTDKSPEEIRNHPEAKAFKMYDDDDELYYEGFWLEDEHADCELDPLDDFGMPNTGCTCIKVNGQIV